MRLIYVVSQKLGAWSGDDTTRAEEIIAGINLTLRRNGRNSSCEKVQEELDAKVNKELQERYKLKVEEYWER